MKTKQEIFDVIAYEIHNAFQEKSRCSYWLEQLPMMKDADFDPEVHEYIKHLQDSLNNKEFFDRVVEYLVDYYYVNQEYYDFD